jgi:threonine/homoserine/homoserine lactone efflux protein
LVGFICTAFVISLSGVLAPGPITAATLAAGTRTRHAGLLIALGHLAVELPAIVLLMVGLGSRLQSPGVRAGIGLAGGAFLLLMGFQLLRSLRSPQDNLDGSAQRHPFWTGALLTVTSPYFWIWGATVGLTLVTQAIEIGLLALVLFALVHWLCDLGWLEILSQAGFKGLQVFGQRGQRVVDAVCAVMLLGFGCKFLYDAGIGLLGGI